MSENITAIVLGVVTHEDDVLLVERRVKESGSNSAVLSWAFP